MHPPTHPADKLSSVLAGLRTSLETASERMVNPVPATSEEAKEVQQARAMNGEIKRLQTIIENLEDELGMSLYTEPAVTCQLIVSRPMP